ncbi:hypothetical protein FOL47_004362 [Perkinsus chesapeaki]|uniref:Uncharacterized protein n=1 Tax=Perkinsus chesapeaki TaxID=330153 RepID=A0A7J6M369_PERCH|nr:hypothetical protein FOL47_004362 [Perkinsus chesapeaki]
MSNDSPTPLSTTTGGSSSSTPKYNNKEDSNAANLLDDYLSTASDEELTRLRDENRYLHQENRNLKLTLTKVEHQVEELFRDYTALLEKQDDNAQSKGVSPPPLIPSHQHHPEITDVYLLLNRMWNKGPRDMVRQMIHAAWSVKDEVMARLRIEFAEKLKEIDAARMRR